jgi:hypothetical protein
MSKIRLGRFPRAVLLRKEQLYQLVIPVRYPPLLHPPMQGAQLAGRELIRVFLLQLLE